MTYRIPRKRGGIYATVGGVATAKIPPEMKHNINAAQAYNAALLKKNKYRNTKCEWRGEKFDSKKELERHLVLLDMQKRNEIIDLVRQPEFLLYVNDKLICKYRGDWQYQEDRGPRWNTGIRDIEWHLVVEDAKGFKTPDFRIKWKLCKALYPEIDWRLS